MRLGVMAFIGALGLAVSAVSANAAPAIPDLGTSAGTPNIIEVAGGCGRGFHPNPWGRCVPNRYSYYGHHYWGAPYYGRWHTPSDYVARDLNRRELGRWGY